VQVLVDAPVWLDFFTGEPSPEVEYLDRSLGRSALAVADLTLAEVLYALPEEGHRRIAEQALRKFWLVQVGGMDLAAKSAVHYHRLLAEGFDVHPVDCLIATWCLENGLALLTYPEVAEPFVRYLGLAVPDVKQKGGV
jgi:predicted nucleic acid-binding protein